MRNEHHYWKKIQQERDETWQVKLKHKPYSILNRYKDSLISDIKDAELPKGVENSLIGPLKQVSKILGDDNPKNNKAACGKLYAFNKILDAKEKSGKIDSDLASELRSDTNSIKVAIGC